MARPFLRRFAPGFALGAASALAFLTLHAPPLHGDSANLLSAPVARRTAQEHELHLQSWFSGAALVMQTHRILSYPIAQVWPTALRYLRVDRGYRITEKDLDAGYIVFEFTVEGGDGATGAGSVEMFEAKDSLGRPSVRIAVSTGAGASHLPHSILDGLADKVRSERGQPPPAPPPPKKPPPEEKPEIDEGLEVPQGEDPPQLE